MINARLDLRRLSPAVALAALNSTPLGTVVHERRLRALRAAAGSRGGDPKTVDLLRLVAWLARTRDRSGVDPEQAKRDAYTKKKIAAREANAEASRLGRDIGPIPPPVDQARRDRCERDLQLFLETYFASDFPLPWSEDHIGLIRDIERRILQGGFKVKAMPRGSGKTTIDERAGIFAVSYGHHRFIGLIGATDEAADEMLDAIKLEWEENELLAEDFPEICLPLRALDGIHNRAAGQHSCGRRTKIKWKGRTIRLPTVEGSRSSGAAIAARGLLSRVRGIKRKINGRTERPTLLIIDDPQTDVSARSELQVQKRMRVMTGAILGVVGPARKLAASCSLTVIAPGDVADQLLDRDANPAWDGTSVPMLRGQPARKDLIDAYFDLRGEDMRTGSKKAAAFYRENQAEIERGYTATWAARHNDDEVSAIQHALHLLQDRGQEVFDAEFQNRPRIVGSGDEWWIEAEEIAKRLSGLRRGTVPLWATRLTAQIDLQQRALYWMVAAFENEDVRNPRGSIIDYGTWPSQKAVEYNYRDLRQTLTKAYPKRGIKGAILAGLADLTNELLDRSWVREDGVEQRLPIVGIDAGNWTDLVHEFARTNKRSAMLMPTKGAGVTADKRPISQYRRAAGQVIGNEWMLTPQPKHRSRLLLFDTNFWKRELFIKLATPLGDPGGLTLFGNEPADHRMLTSHLRSESPTRTEGGGRTVHVFHERPDRPDNHLFDVAVGCLVLNFQPLTGRRRRRATRKSKPLW